MPVGLHQEQSQLNFKAIFKDFGLLLTKPTFVIPMLLQGLTYVMLFSYSSAAPFISQKMYHMTPLQYSAMFAINGVGLIVVSQITAIIVEKISRYAMLIYLTIIQMLGVVILIFTLTLHLPLYVLLIGFLLIYVQSLLAPLCFSMAMAERRWKWQCFKFWPIPIYFRRPHFSPSWFERSA